MLFVDEMPRVRRGYKRKIPEGRRCEYHKESSEHVPAIKEPKLSQGRESYPRVHEYNDSLCRFISPAEDGIHLTFLYSKLFSGAPAREQKTLVEKSWIFRFTRQSGSSEAEWDQIPISSTCALATQALAKVFFGQMHGQQDIIVRGAVLYGSALRSLRNDLQHSTCESFSLLASLITVYVYEVGCFFVFTPQSLSICSI